MSSKTDEELIQEQARIYAEGMRKHLLRKQAEKRAKNEVPPPTRPIHDMPIEQYAAHRNAQIKGQRK